MSNYPESQKSNNLNLSWPKSVKYDIEVSPALGNHSVSQAAVVPNTDGETPVTTYNGVPRELLRKAQILLEYEIRVLDLRRGTREDPLVGSLRKVRISDPIVFEPLSYTWKDYEIVRTFDTNEEIDTSRTISIENSDTFINIGTNCDKALRSVRKPTTERTIWVDSICVNQDDLVERSSQVDLMRKIFARAFTVLVYLGEESTEHDSSLAMSLLGQPQRLRDFDGLDQSEISSLKHLFERPYFRRMWIVQEVGLAPTLELHCGSAIAYLPAFVGKSLEAIVGSTIVPPPWLKHSKYTYSPLRNGPTAEHMLSLIFDTALCSCKDDRDRVFALLSLLNVRDEEGLRADYSLSTVQVYTGIAAFLAVNGLAWAVLMLAPRSPPHGYTDLPSWVPNWKMLENTDLEAPKILVPQALNIKSQKFRFQPVSAVASSGVITVRSKILGLVTASDYGPDYMAEHRARMRNHHRLVLENLDGGQTEITSHVPTERCIWTLKKPAQSPFDDLWACHIEFMTDCRQSSNAQHLAVLLEDCLTVLILRHDDRLRDEFTLVETGMPLVWGTIPRDWARDDNDRCIEIPLQSLSLNLKDPRLHDTPFHPEQFPRLRHYSHLWAYNPATSSMTLTYKAIEKILSTDLTLLDLWSKWQEQARYGIQILRDKTRLRTLIDEVQGIGQEDYRRMEVQAGLTLSWSLDRFLSLFVKDPSKTGPMEWPNTHVEVEQSSEATAALPLLMRWAEVTYRFLEQFQSTVKYAVPWLNSQPPEIEDPFPDAVAVARSQRLTASVVTNLDGHETSYPDRASFLLGRILQQSSESADLEDEQGSRVSWVIERYWDWKKFESTVEEGLSILRHVQPDVTNLQSSFELPLPYFGGALAHHLLAAHGVDLRKSELVEIRIR